MITTFFSGLGHSGWGGIILLKSLLHSVSDCKWLARSKISYNKKKERGLSAIYQLFLVLVGARTLDCSQSSAATVTENANLKDKA